MRKIILSIVYIVVVLNLTFISRGVAAIINATSCSNADIQSSINLASSGDTVMVPSGTCTWTGIVSWNNKNIKLIGAGSGTGGTQINTSTRAIESTVYSQTENNSRISGFKFNYVGAASDVDYIVMKGQGWRVDNNSIENNSGSGHSMVCVLADGSGSGGIQPFGLVDNNYMYECRVRVFGGATGIYWSGSLAAWADDSAIGTANAMYVEDNTFYRKTTGGEWNDASLGGKFVLRYNTFTGDHQMHSHSIQGPQMRAARSWEVYGNKMVSNPAQAIFFRGGTGMIFYNSLTGSTSSVVSFDNVRSATCNDGQCGTANPDSVLCNGYSYWDGNSVINPASGVIDGWPCRDQIGRGKDVSLFNTTYYPSSTSEPAYLWSNWRGNGTIVPVSISTAYRNSYHIVANRDYYDYQTSFNGTSGVGCGTLAARPATCAKGVSYWATNQSCADLTGKVGARPSTPIDGTLYQCTTTNTWTAYYTPYTYPHPLRGGRHKVGSGPQFSIGSGATVTIQ